jgi:hypothetical protein
MGEIAWSFFTPSDQKVALSIADILYFAAYPLIGLGLVVEYRLAEVKIGDIRKSALISSSLVGLSLGVAVVYFGVYLAYDPALTPLTNIVTIAYGIADLFLVIFSLLLVTVVWTYKGGKIALPWTCFLVGLFFTLLSDILFAIFSSEYDSNLYLTFLMDVLWFLSYFSFATSFYLQFDNVRKAKLKIKGGLPSSAPN